MLSKIPTMLNFKISNMVFISMLFFNTEFKINKEYYIQKIKHLNNKNLKYLANIFINLCYCS